MRMLAAFYGGLAVRVGSLGLGLAATLRLVCTRQMSLVNSYQSYVVCRSEPGQSCLHFLSLFADFCLVSVVSLL